MSEIERKARIAAAGHSLVIGLAALTVATGVAGVLVGGGAGNTEAPSDVGLHPHLRFAGEHFGGFVGGNVVLGILLVAMGRGLLRFGVGRSSHVLGVGFLVAAGTIVASVLSLVDVVTAQFFGTPSNVRRVPLVTALVGLVLLVLAVWRRTLRRRSSLS